MQIDFNAKHELSDKIEIDRWGLKPYTPYSLLYPIRSSFQNRTISVSHKFRSAANRWLTPGAPAPVLASRAEQPEYRPAAADASTSDSGAILPAPDADDGHSEQHCSGSAADPHPAAASSTAAAPRQVCGFSEGSPADVLPCS
jgi:hypothetical protein